MTSPSTSRSATFRASAVFIMVCLLCFPSLAVGPATLPTKSPATRPAAASNRASTIIIEGTLEAAMGQPRIHVQLSDDKGVLSGKPLPAIPGLGDLGAALDGDRPTRDRSFIAYLDTGASGYVICKSTAERFGIQAQKDAAYHEVGLHGATLLGVSVPYNIALADSSGDADERPPAKFDPIQRQVALQLNHEAPAGFMALLGEINVVGMPAINKMVIEIDPAPMRGQRQLDVMNPTGPVVRLHDRQMKPKDVDVTIALEKNDYNQRKHPDNRGPLPELASSPVIPNIESSNGQLKFTGDWLVDTGAATSIISTKQAQALGLYDENGQPLRKADFTLPLGGIGGDIKPADGYIIDSLSLKARAGKTLEFRGVHVVVQNVGTRLHDGREVILDGVLGMNLFLPSAAGLAAGAPTKIDDGTFDRIWIDGPRSTLSLKCRAKTKAR